MSLVETIIAHPWQKMALKARRSSDDNSNAIALEQQSGF
jgi:hypothetical protein